MTVTVTGLTPTKVERESTVSLTATVAGTGDLAGAAIHFAVTDWGARPGTWGSGSWRGAETGPRRVAGSAKLGPFTPGVRDVWARVKIGGETYVIKIGQLTVR